MSRRRGGGAVSGIGWLAGLAAVACTLGLIGVKPAMAAIASPHWSIVSESSPSNFKAGDVGDAFVLMVRNDGALSSTPTSATTITDSLPDGVTATSVSARGEGPNGNGSPRYNLSCPGAPLTSTVTCTYGEPVPVLAGTTIVMTITVSIAEGVHVLQANSATVSGGGAPSASVSEPVALGTEPASFGLSRFDTEITDESGDADTQAGSHPFELTADFAFTISSREVGGSESPLAGASAKDLDVELPAGLVGDPNAVPRCGQQEFQERENLDCPLDTQVGTVKPYFYGESHSAVFPVFDIAPPPGQPVELGFTIAGIGHVPMFFHVRSDGDYGLTAQLNDIPEAGPLQGASLTLWGVPAAGSHDFEREGTIGEGRRPDGEEGEVCKPEREAHEVSCPSGVAAKPFLTLPSECAGDGLSIGVLSDSWQDPGQFQTLTVDPFPSLERAALTGCEHLSFNPSIAVLPETSQAGAPSGYTVDLRVPQDEDPTGLATPDLRTAVVALPAGVVLSPSAANGLQACADAQFGLHSLSAASCPAASTIGTVQITTPALANPLEGQLFLGSPNCGPCAPGDAREGRLIRLFAQAQGAGVIVKLQGSASIDQSTGQLTATFAEDPQWPIEQLKLSLDGGPRAPLANPSICGSPLAGTAQLTPYSSETAVQRSSAPLQLSGCASSRFAPMFIAGTTNNQAGAFSPLTVSVSRTDQDQDLQRIAVRLAPGLLGMLSRFAPCAEAQAQAATCSAQSEIGTASVGAGPGSEPVYLTGSVYLTGPYEGAPFGLSIVVAAMAGPFDLGVLDIRAAVNVDPSTAALTITSDPLPQSIDGIRLQIKTVSLDIEREGFTFNPTSCDRLSIEGAVLSAEGAMASASSPFQAANCAMLPFKPKLTALTHARSSRAGGVYLHVRVASGHGQANIAKLKVDLPARMPARLSTLHDACPATLVAQDPAGCPTASVVGAATAVTPILDNPLSGPVYLISHGGSASPSLEIVLQGEGVTMEIVGQTSVAHGVASSAFRSLPDVPLSTFDLVLTEGPHSLLAANLPAKAKRSMCAQKLEMPTAVTAQNGAVVKQATIVAVSGCPTRRRRLRA